MNIRTRRWLLCVVFLFLVTASCRGADLPTTESGGRELRAHTPIQATLDGSERHTYRVRLQAGHSTRLIVEQHEADLVVTLRTSEEEAALEIDARERGTEVVAIVARASSTYQIEIRTLDPASARVPYEIRFEPPRPTGSEHRLHEKAQDLTTAGKRLAAAADRDDRQRALDFLQEALALWREIGDAGAEAATLSMLGDLRHGRSEYGEAEKAYLDALVLSERLGDRRHSAELLNNLGLGCWARGSLTEAGRYFGLALEHWRAIAFPFGEAATLTNQGLLFWEVGDYQEALGRYLEAARIFEQLENLEGQAYIFNNIGMTSRALGDEAAALVHLGRALALFRELEEPIAEARTLVRIGRLHRERGDQPAAREHATAALTLLRATDDRVAEADAVALLGEIAESSGEARAALTEYERALEGYRSAGSRRGKAAALHHIGQALGSLQETMKARESLERALSLRRDLGLRDAEAETLHALGLVEWRAKRMAKAREYLRAALARIEDVRGRVAGEYSRTSYFAARQRYYASYIDFLMTLHARQPSSGFAIEAFEISERARARVLLELLVGSGTEIRRGMDEALLAEERELQARLNLWSHRLARLADRDGSELERAEAVRELDEALQRYRRTEAQIRMASRGRAAANPEPLDLREIQGQVLDADSVLLRFVLGDAHSYVFVVTPRTLRAVPLPSAAEIEPVARRVHELVSTRTGDRGARDVVEELEREASTLSALLLEPVAEHLPGKRLLIVCDGILQFIPFAALPVPGAGVPLVSRHEIVVLPSASALAALRQEAAGRSPPSGTVAVLADPVYEPDDPRVTGGGPAGVHATRSEQHPVHLGRIPISRLPFSRFEGESILDLVPRPHRFGAFGFTATRETVMGARISEARIVHLAVHAVQDASRPELSGIVLSLLDASGASRDGFLRLHDIYRGLRLRADLVVLSACETALGRDVPGEGPMALARGFFHAGATRVVASLYKVDDEATAEFMRLFYEELLGSDESSPAAALRAAQLWMLEHDRWRDPYWWSAFVLIGEPR